MPRNPKGSGTQKPRKQAKQPPRRWLFLAAGTALGVALGLIALSWLGGKPAPPTSIPSPLGAPFPGTEKGSPAAPVVMEDFSDFQCRFCALFALETLPLLEREFVVTGKVRLVFRHFPFLGEESFPAAEAAQCAAEQGRFWEYHDLLFSRFTGVQRGTFSPERLKSYARELGLNQGDFNRCLDSDKFRKKVQDDLAQGKERGVRATPTFFINGKKVEGALPAEDFRRLIREALEGR